MHPPDQPFCALPLPLKDTSLPLCLFEKSTLPLGGLRGMMGFGVNLDNPKGEKEPVPQTVVTKVL